LDGSVRRFESNRLARICGVSIAFFSQNFLMAIKKINLLKLIGLFFISLPILLLLAFTIGETAGGDISGLQHIVQAIPFILLAILAWKKSTIGGYTIIGISLILALLYCMYPTLGFTKPVRLINAAILFCPLLLGGLLFVLSTRNMKPKH
jgi:hypothetical protein